MTQKNLSEKTQFYILLNTLFSKRSRYHVEKDCELRFQSLCWASLFQFNVQTKIDSWLGECTVCYNSGSYCVLSLKVIIVTWCLGRSTVICVSEITNGYLGRPKCTHPGNAYLRLWTWPNQSHVLIRCRLFVKESFTEILNQWFQVLIRTQSIFCWYLGNSCLWLHRYFQNGLVQPVNLDAVAAKVNTVSCSL